MKVRTSPISPLDRDRSRTVLVAAEGEQTAAEAAEQDTTILRHRARQDGVLEVAQRHIAKRRSLRDDGRARGDGRAGGTGGEEQGNHDERV